MNTETKAPTEDAVEKLVKILNAARCNSTRVIGNVELAQRILKAGYTLRRETMTEAELSATANTIATMAFSVSDVRVIETIKRDIENLAKKYRK